MKIYKKALQFQKDGDRENAHKEYDALFNIEVLNLSQSTGLPPAAELLKYVAFKNHALLLLSDLDHEKDSVDIEEFDERVRIIIDEFSEALLYDSDEDLFLELLYSICMSLGYFRIARLCLECIIESPSRSNSLYEDFKSGKILSPSEYRVLKNYFLLSNKLNDKSTLDFRRDTADLALGMEFIDSRFDEKENVGWLSKTSESELKPHSFVYDGSIAISSADWLSILESVQEFVMSLAAKTKRKLNIEDPYNNSLKPANSITLGLPIAEVVEETTQSIPMDVDIVEEVDETTKNTEEIKETVSCAADTPMVELASKKKRRKSFDEAMRSRTSKRVRARADEKQNLEDVDLTEDKSFFSQINSFLALCNEEFLTIIPTFLNSEDCPKSDMYVCDFKSMILNWDEEQAEILGKIKTESKNKLASKKPLLSQIIDTPFSSDKSDIDRPNIMSTSQLASGFIESATSSKLHVQELRMELIRSITLPVGSEPPPILSEAWPLTAVDMVKKVVEQCELQLTDFSHQVLQSGSNEDIFKEIYMVQTILEIITDTYLNAMKVLRTPDHHGKQILKDMELVRSTSPYRYSRWRRILGDLILAYGRNTPELESLILRHEWTNVLVQSVESEEVWENMDDFLAVENDILTVNEHFKFTYINFPSLPDLSLSCIRSQISRIKALETLSQVFVEPSKGEKKTNDDQAKVIYSRISLLECVLMPEYQDTSPAEYKTISDYFIDAPLKLRSRFWTILLSDYSSVGETQKSLDGYLMLLSDTINEFAGEQYQLSSDSQRNSILIQSIFMCHDIFGNIMGLLGANDLLVENVKASKLKSYMSAIIKLLRMLHIFILYSDATVNSVLPIPTHNSWDKMGKKFKELIVYGWCLFYVIFRACLPEEAKTPDILNDMLSIIHEQLGTRGYCGMCNGILLDISLKELMRLNFNESDADLLQCLHCRYGIVMGQEDFHPYDHYTTPEEIDKNSALMLVSFVMRIALKKKNMSQNILRADVKGVLDQLNEAIGLPDQTIPAIEKNNAALNNLLNANISILFLQECFYGRFTLELARPSSSLYQLASSGFYHILGQTRMALFRVKKRVLPGRTEDILEAIRFFKYDLMCGCSNRFETWFGLSQAYDVLVEDDLTYTTYKINSASAREAVGIRQRKAIISCAIAINCYLQNGSSTLFANTPAYQQLIGSAWFFFARLLFNSIQAPLQMEAYVSDKYKLLCGPDGLYNHSVKYKIGPKVILKSALLCLRLASKEVPNDWHNYYLKGMCLHQLKADPLNVLNTFVKSLELTPTKSSGHGELILEPHYKLVSRVYKYVRSDSISVDVALKYLKKTHYFDDSTTIGPGSDPEKDKVYGICISTLLKIKASDKKKWHHRPTYRISKIYEECGDVAKAKEEISVLFQLKPSSKQPIHIWKTEYERPGQHFIYINQYMKYLITLLERTNDFTSFGVLSKSLRKFTSGMIDHQAVWELLCTTVARILKEKLEIPAKFNDSVIPQLLFSEFDKTSTRIIEIAESDEELHPMFKYLNYAAELRRLNNGFGSTAALDDLFVALYLTLYQDFAQNIFPKKDSASKVATPPPEVKSEIAAPVVVQPSTKISVMDLLSQPSTPILKPSTPVPGDHKANSSTPASIDAKPSTPTGKKTRVTRRDIISKALAAVRSALPKLMQGDNMKIESPSPGANKLSTGVADSASGSKSPSSHILNDTKDDNLDGTLSRETPGIKDEEMTDIKPSEALKSSISALLGKDSGQSTHDAIDIDEEAETVPSTPVREALASGHNPDPSMPYGHEDEEEEGNVTTAHSETATPVGSQKEGESPRPKSRNSNWLSTIM